ncbi:MAG TPA: STM4013/SEN3800 family hydrolase [Verrucomicrobiae bacterium]|jgi:hypothetical protein
MNSANLTPNPHAFHSKWDMNAIVGSHDILFLVLDALRFDVAEAEMCAARTPNFAKIAPHGWEKRHTPGSFTYAALHSFFAGFLPTPAEPGGSRHERLFAVRFAGSETIGPRTKIFEAGSIVAGLRGEGYRTICIGGVGFFNEQTALSQVFPNMFCEAHWKISFGVTDPNSTERQFSRAADRIAATSAQQPLFLFVNVSAIHQPNYFYARQSGPDDLESHAAALRYVDAQLPALFRGFARRQRPLFAIICSDHGTAYGDDGYAGHRLAHPCVWNVPYWEGIVNTTDFS